MAKAKQNLLPWQDKICGLISFFLNLWSFQDWKVWEKIPWNQSSLKIPREFSLIEGNIYAPV
jgi:hypothetical protein